MIRRNHSVSRTCRLLRVARSRVNVLLKCTNDWKDHRLACNRSNNQLQDNNLQQKIQEALARHPSFGYKRLTAVINRKRQKVNHPRVNAKRVYRVAKQRNLLLVGKPSLPGYSKEHNGQVSVDASNKRWCSDGLEFKCFNGEHVSMTFVLDCCDREVISFVAKKGRGLAAWMAQEQVLLAVNRRFGSVNHVPTPLQFLTDNGSAYTSQKTRHLLKALGIEDCKTAVGIPQSNDMAESFVKTLKRDYLPFIDLESAETALSSFPDVVKLYNEEHPHSALGYLSPVEFREKKGLIEPQTKLDDPICLIPGFMLSNSEERLENVC